MRIPIQNIYYLLCYAWNRLEEGGTVDVSSVGTNQHVDLFATVLISGLNHLVRRGLHREYVEFRDDLASIRGRIDVARSARRMLMQHGKAHCTFDELSVDNLPNQIIKSTLLRLVRTEGVDKKLRQKALRLCSELNEISEIPLTRLSFRQVQLGSNSRYYSFLLSVCELIVQNLLVDESSGRYQFRDFLRDDRRMAMLFESFLFNFVRLERPDLRVRKENIAWDATALRSEDMGFLPKMETDISVRSDERTVVFEAKFYRESLSTYFGSESIHSSNIYQIFSYLKNLERRGGADAEATGVLVYPEVDRKLRLDFDVQGHRFSVVTLNLAAHWTTIREEFLDVIESYFSSRSSVAVSTEAV